MNQVDFQNLFQQFGMQSSKDANVDACMEHDLNTKMYDGMTKNNPTRKISKETIHSGHFMVSEIDDSEAAAIGAVVTVEHESDYESPEQMPVQLPVKSYDLESACLETSHTYMFGLNSVSIDGSLAKLFECMSLAYSGKITSPKWKTFKGLKLKLKDKIRLNNIIWRAWHIQYINRRNPMICQFSSPIDGDPHNKPQAIVLEGKYWKRRLATVTAEYKKWRMYSKKTGTDQTPTRPSHFNWENRWPTWATSTNSMPGIDDDMSMDFSDTLFNTLLTPNMIDFPNPREIARAGYGADFLQPGLIQLQPSLDDFMDTFEPLHEFLSSRSISTLPVLQEEVTSENNTSSLLTEQDNQKIDSLQISSENLEQGLLNSLLCQTSPDQQQTNILDTNSFSSINKPNVLESNLSLNQSNSFMSNAMIQYKQSSNNNKLSQNQVSFANGFDESMQQSIGSMTQALPSSSLVSQQQQPSFESNDSSVLSTLLYPQQQQQQQQQQQVTNSLNYSQFGLCNQTQTHTNTQQTNMNTSSNVQYNANKSMSPSYYSNNELAVNIKDKFAVPKSAPPRQKTQRSRSISGPQGNNLYQNAPSFASPTTTHSHSHSHSQVHQSMPQSAMSLIDINANRPTQAVERSTSLPVYTHERKRNIASNPNAQLMNHLIMNQHSNSQIYAEIHQPTDKKLKTHNNNNFFPPNHQQVPALLNNSNPINYQFTSQSSNSIISQLLSNSSSTLTDKLSNAQQRLCYSSNDIRSGLNKLDSNMTLSSEALSTNLGQQSQSQSQSLSGSTVDASCIGISVTSSVGHPDSKTQFVFSPMAFKDERSSSNNNSMQSNILIHHRPHSASSSPLKSRGSPVASYSHSQSQSASPSHAQCSPTKDILTSIPPSVSSPPSSTPPQLKGLKLKSREDRNQYKEHRRVCHINAEQKRRCNIKNGFDTLRNLLPSMSQNASTKVSKAAMLAKAGEYIRTLKNERHQQLEETDLLRQQIETLNDTIGVFQNQLPATGAPVSCQRANQTKEQYEAYVRARTLQNWKFWIFSIIMESLYDSYNTTVATNNVDEMSKTLLRWLEQSCSLGTLRRDVLNSLRYLSTSTNILTNPATLPEEAVLAVTKKEKQQQQGS